MTTRVALRRPGPDPMPGADFETAAAARSTGPSNLARFCRARVLARLATLDGGRLRIRDADGEHAIGADTGLEAEVVVHDPHFWKMMATGGSVGAGEAYMAGLWDSPDLVAVIRVLAASRAALSDMERGAARLYAGVLKFLHRLNRNSLSGSRRNIAAHYDLGNAFFAEWLDPRMQYSSAIFATEDESLAQAQENKLARIAERLELGADDHLLEIGTGWGGLAIYMAETTGCRVTTTTISREQHAYAVERIREAGLEDRIEVLLKDYRDLDGTYDKLVSVEMIEAVGANYLDTYLNVFQQRLKPEGLALIQAITIEDFRYREALKNVDFIQRYIFPGAFIPSVSAITGAMARASDLGLIELFDFGESYARTLRAWREKFEEAWNRIEPMGFDETFRRRWRFYLAYCEGGFMERAISDVHVLMARPGYRKTGR